MGRWKKRRCFGGDAIMAVGGGAAAARRVAAPSYAVRGAVALVGQPAQAARPSATPKRASSSWLDCSGPAPYSATFGEHRAYSAAYELNFAPTTTTTRPKTRQQLS